MVDQSKKTVFLCAGGTGGHMFPAMALADDLHKRDLNVVLVTDKRGLRFVNDQSPAIVETISSATLPKGLIGKIKGALGLGLGFVHAWRLVRKYRPSIMIGFGGYPSLPTMVMGQRADIPTIIHEQNAVLGRANAYLAPKADRIALSLQDQSSLEEADAIRAIVTGNPVRSDISALYAVPYNIPNDDEMFRILVMGGSQGAKSFDDIIPQAMTNLPESVRSRLNVLQQCSNDEDAKIVRKAYVNAGIQADIRPFIDDVAEALKTAHLMIARSGASTVAEVSIAGVPAIYVPYPHHADHQQRVNAKAFVDAGGAWMLEEGSDFTPTQLSARIESLVINPEELFNAAEAARNLARPEAARKLGNLVVAMIKGWDKIDTRQFDYTQGHKG
jgi:UDP-N-acetylglucosamine--N-acetylmuramyl-(pentapeptide) pyrophosphoryl-undecaprenol N-acetylglucosamine transferase